MLRFQSKNRKDSNIVVKNAKHFTKVFKYFEECIDNLKKIQQN